MLRAFAALAALVVAAGVAAGNPTPPKELIAYADNMKGPFTCAGTTIASSTKVAITAAYAHTLVLDRAWLETSYTAQTANGTHKVTQHTTFDPIARTWTRIKVDNAGATEILSSPGPKSIIDWNWEGEMRHPNSPTPVKTRWREWMGRADRDPDGVVRTKDIFVTGEQLVAGTWSTTYEAHCKTNRSANYSKVTDFLWTSPPRPGSGDVRLLVRVGGKPLVGEQDSDVVGRFQFAASINGRFAVGAKFDTNPNGRYVFNGLMPNTYSISVEDTRKELKPWKQDNVVIGSGAAVTLIVDLTK